MKKNYPNWIGRDLIGKSLPWDESTEASMPAFLSEYMLRDSYWIIIYLQPNLEAVAVIRWDTYWTRVRVPFPSVEGRSWVADWPILLISFGRMYQVYHSYQERNEAGWPGVTEIHGANSVLVVQDEREEVLDCLLRKPGPEEIAKFLVDDTLHHMTFIPIFGAWLNLLHGGVTWFLCLGKEGKILPIPDL